MSHRPVGGIGIRGEPAKQGRVKSHWNIDQVVDAAVLQMGLTDDDRLCHRIEMTRTIHLANLKNQSVIKKALVPPKLRHILPLDRLYGAHVGVLLDGPCGIDIRPTRGEKELHAQRPAWKIQRLLSVDRSVQPQCNTAKYRVG